MQPTITDMRRRSLQTVKPANGQTDMPETKFANGQDGHAKVKPANGQTDMPTVTFANGQTDMRLRNGHALIRGALREYYC